MPFYISRYTGTGTEEDSFRPVVADYSSEWAAIDLRVDASQVDGWAFAWTPGVLSPLPTGVLLVAAGVDEVLTAQVRNAINSNLGVSLPKDTTFRQAVRRLMTTEGRLDGTRWPPITPDQSGQLKLFLGDYVDVWQP